MGLKRKPPTRRARIDPTDVRIAVQHLIELAAGFEGRGADVALRKGKRSDVLAHSGWEPTEEDETFEDDERCLKDVVKLLLAHRKRQQQAQRNAFVEGLVFWLSQAYRAYLRDHEIPALTLETKVRELCDALALKVGDEELLLLAPERGGADDADVDGEADTLHAMEGAVESAKTIVGKLVGLSFRRIREIRDEHGHPLAFARRPFGRFIPRRGRLAYVTELYDLLEGATRNPSIAFADLRAFEEATSVAVDRVAENLMARSVEEPAFLAANLPREMRARIAATKEADARKLRTHVGSLVEAGLAAITASNLPEGLRKAALDVAEANARRAPAAEREPLETALETSIEETADQVFVEAMRAAAMETYGAALDTIRKQ
jgi:hypothetical protein